jgi:hypothetical protein
MSGGHDDDGTHSTGCLRRRHPFFDGARMEHPCGLFASAIYFDRIRAFVTSAFGEPVRKAHLILQLNSAFALVHAL